MEKNWRQVMGLSAVTTTQMAIAIGVAVMVVAGIAIWLFVRKRRTKRLRAQFGGAEYTRAMKEGGSRRQAEAGLDKRTERVEGLHIRPLTPGDRTRFVASWGRVQARFVDGPGGAVTEADQLLGDVMSARGYPVSDFDQRAADISVDHPLARRYNLRLHFRRRDTGACNHTGKRIKCGCWSPRLR